MSEDNNKLDFQVFDKAKSKSILATNSVLKNTYMLLGMTLFFSGLMAKLSMVMQIPMISPWIYLIAVVGLQFLVYATANSGIGIISVFLLTGFIGFYTGPLLNLILTSMSNGQEIIMTALGGTGIIFVSLSSYVLITRKNMSFLGNILFVGMIVGFIAAIAGMFFQITALQLTVSCLFMLLSSGLILFETSNILHGGETNYIRATVTLYVSLYNLFISLLNILMAFNRD